MATRKGINISGHYVVSINAIYICRYIPHDAHFIPIVGVGKRGAY